MSTSPKVIEANKAVKEAAEIYSKIGCSMDEKLKEISDPLQKEYDDSRKKYQELEREARRLRDIEYERDQIQKDIYAHSVSSMDSDHAYKQSLAGANSFILNKYGEDLS